MELKVKAVEGSWSCRAEHQGRKPQKEDSQQHTDQQRHELTTQGWGNVSRKQHLEARPKLGTEPALLAQTRKPHDPGARTTQKGLASELGNY